jgi:hypothetical protein
VIVAKRDMRDHLGDSPDSDSGCGMILYASE